MVNCLKKGKAKGPGRMPDRDHAYLFVFESQEANESSFSVHQSVLFCLQSSFKLRSRSSKSLLTLKEVEQSMIWRITNSEQRTCIEISSSVHERLCSPRIIDAASNRFDFSKAATRKTSWQCFSLLEPPIIFSTVPQGPVLPQKRGACS